MLRKLLISGLVASLPFSTLSAGEVEILDVVATQSNGTWHFAVTVKHADTGWDHYADGWEVLTLEGTSLGYRTLAHPHVNEQPFTRALGGINIPEGITDVMIRARDTDGWSDTMFNVKLP
ncbi:MAG: hypothetical protein V3V13_05735 [Paracoccaceae bacterium]